MLANKFWVFIVVGLTLVLGFGVYPSFNSLLRTQSTVGMSTQFTALTKFMPYVLFFVIGYAAYVVWKKGKQ
jgi:hypothetical protein